MTVDTFFEKFNLFADAPDAIEKMRAIVLHFAVTGKLVPSRSDDTSIDQTFKDLASLVIDSPNGLPPLWRVISLGDLGEWRGGGTPSKARADFWNGTIPWVSPKDMKTLSIGDAQDHISREAIESCSTKLLPSGTILMVVRGMILVHTFPVAVTTREVTINQDMKALTPTHAALTDFILLTLRAIESRVLNAIERSSHGTCKLLTEVLESLPIALPPLAEQKRIVAKVDELMALCDRLEAQQKEREAKHAVLARAALARFAEAPTPANLEYLFHNAFEINADELRTALLILAVAGRLLSENERPHDEVADEELLLDDASTAELQPLPSGWIWSQVKLTGRVDLGRQRAPKHHIGPNMRPYLRVQNVYEARLDLSDVKEMNFTPQEFKTFELLSGDILLNEGQSFKLVGRPAIYRGEIPGACFQNTLVRYRPGKAVIAEYALLVFRAYMRNGRFQTVAKQTTNIAHLSAGRFATLEFPLPPLAEQRRIVAKVDALMALVDRLEAQLAESRTLAGRLMEAVVHELTTASEIPAATAMHQATPVGDYSKGQE